MLKQGYNAAMTRPTKTAIATYWARHGANEVPNPGFVDLCEPACFACQWYVPRWNEAKLPWEAAKGLERAHIVAHSAGGSDEPSNFVLLCLQCHEEAPMTTDPEDMFRWIAQREGFIARAMRTIHTNVLRQGFTEADLILALPLKKNGTLEARLKGIADTAGWGLHASNSRRGPIMTTGTVSAILGKLLAELRHE